MVTGRMAGLVPSPAHSTGSLRQPLPLHCHLNGASNGASGRVWASHPLGSNGHRAQGPSKQAPSDKMYAWS